MDPKLAFRAALDDLQKEALQLPPSARQAAGTFGHAMLTGVGAAAAAGLMAGTVGAAQNIYQSLTRERDFKRMMALDPDLHHVQSEVGAPRFNAAFNSLRGMNPDFARDPYVASSFMRTFAGQPAGGTGLVASVYDKKRSPHPVLQQGMSAAANAFKPLDSFARQERQHAMEQMHSRGQDLQHHQATRGIREALDAEKMHSAFHDLQHQQDTWQEREDLAGLKRKLEARDLAHRFSNPPP